MLSKRYGQHNFTTLPPHFIIVSSMYKCEILTLQSDFSICWTKMCASEESFH